MPSTFSFPALIDAFAGPQWTNIGLACGAFFVVFLLFRGFRGDVSSFILGMILLAISVFAFAGGLFAGVPIPGITYQQ